MNNTVGTFEKEHDEYGDVTKVAFLAELYAGETVSAAALTAGSSRESVYRWRNQDYEFAQAWDDAVDVGTEVMEQEAIRRGVRGVMKPVFHLGQIVGHVQEYSDTLLIFMLKARKPDVYRERATFEHTGKGGRELAAPITNVQAGVLVVPGLVTDENAWTALVQGAMQPTIDPPSS